MEFVPLETLTVSLQPTEIQMPTCPICDRVLASDDELQRHMDSLHPDWARLLCASFLAATPRENG